MNGRGKYFDKFISEAVREATRTPRILLLDDDKDVVACMQQAVKKLDCHLFCYSGASCMNCGHVTDEDYDLILVDLIQPGVDVPKLVLELKEKKKNTACSIVVFTRYPGSPEALAIIQAGATPPFFIKPNLITEETIISMLRDFRIKRLQPSK